MMAMDFDTAHAELDAMLADAAAERQATRRLIPCWACNERNAVCGRPDCARRWRLKDGPPVDGDGKSVFYPKEREHA